MHLCVPALLVGPRQQKRQSHVRRSTGINNENAIILRLEHIEAHVDNLLCHNYILRACLSHTIAFDGA